jgi:hypothetical protein
MKLEKSPYSESVDSGTVTLSVRDPDGSNMQEVTMSTKGFFINGKKVTNDYQIYLEFKKCIKRINEMRDKGL